MKRIPARSFLSKLSSFTLVELLVVIAIIAILAGVLLSAGGLAIKMAKRTKAANMATQLQTAALAYYTEYSVYPVPGGTTLDYVITDVTGSKIAWQNLICSLSGNIHPSTGQPYTAVAATPTNSRGIAFLSLKVTDVDANDAPVNPLPTGTGATAQIYFNIAIDSDYDGVLGTIAPTSTAMPNFSATPFTATGGTSTAGVAVWANCNGSTSSTNGNWWVHTY